MALSLSFILGILFGSRLMGGAPPPPPTHQPPPREVNESYPARWKNKSKTEHKLWYKQSCSFQSIPPELIRVHCMLVYQWNINNSNCYTGRASFFKENFDCSIKPWKTLYCCNFLNIFIHKSSKMLYCPNFLNILLKNITNAILSQ